jgi:2-iminoacetate synthase
MSRAQFELHDTRPLDEVVRELIHDGYVPSWCTSCYRLGRTGEHFMEFSVPGFIKRYCTPNALTTLAEYLTDHATPETRREGLALIEKELERMEQAARLGTQSQSSDDWVMSRAARGRIEKIRTSDERDVCF